jgi:hypothetical protein
MESPVGWEILPQVDYSVRYLGSLVFVPCVCVYSTPGGFLVVQFFYEAY